MNDVDVGGYYEEDQYNDNYGAEKEGDSSFGSDDKVAKALSDITHAPNELADYVKLLASTHSQASGMSDLKLVKTIGGTLAKDKMVTASGKKLDIAVSKALNCILDKNIPIDYDNSDNGEKRAEKYDRKHDRSDDNEQTHQKRIRAGESSRNYRSNNRNDRNYPYKERRGQQQHLPPPPPPQRNQDYGSYPPRYSNGSNPPQQQYSHNSQQRGGPSHNQPSNYGHHSRSRPPPPPPPQRGPSQIHDMKSNYAAPPPPPPYRQNHRDASPGGFNSNNKNVPPPPPPPTHNRHHTKYQGSHRLSKPNSSESHGHGHGYGGHDNDQKRPSQRNMKHTPPPHPPPSQNNHIRHHNRGRPLPDEERRTIFLSNLPPPVTHKQLLHYFTRKMNVIVNTLKLEPLNNDHNFKKNENKNKQENRPQRAYVELATHDQAMFIYHNPDPVLGNRFIGIEMHPYNLNVKPIKNNKNDVSQTPETSTSQYPHKQPSHDKKKHTAEPIPSVESDKHGYYPTDEDQQTLETYKNKEALLKQTVTNYGKLLAMHKKMYSVLQKTTAANDSIETKKQVQAKLMEILAMQKKYNQASKDQHDMLSKTSDLEKKTSIQYYPKQFAQSLNQEPKRYSLDKRTTALKVTKFPDDTNEETITRHFNAFGKVSAVKMLDKSAQVTFANRAFAERAKNNASFFNDCTLDLEWLQKDSSGDGSSKDQNGKKIEDESAQIECEEVPRDPMLDEDIEKEHQEDDDFDQDDDESRWR